MGAIAVVIALTLAACSGSSEEAEKGAGLPAACKKPPVVMQVESREAEVAGSERLEVTDAVARRVAIVPKAKIATSEERAAAEAKAAKTSLGYYTLYLATFPIDRAVLAGAGTGDITPTEGQTLGAVSFVPTSKQGFEVGDIATSAPLGYETTSTFTPMVAVVHEGPDGEGQAFDDAKGKVEILALTAKQICVDIDVTLLDGTKPVYLVKGSVLAPVVEADPSYFST